MSLVLKYKKFIDKIISDMEEDICKKITQDASVCNNVVDLILEYSDEYDIDPEYDIYYYRNTRSYDTWHLVVLDGDLKMTKEKLKGCWNEDGPNILHDISKYNSLIKTIEENKLKEIHIWMGESTKIKFPKLKIVANEIANKIREMYPEMDPVIDLEDSPSLAGDEVDLVIVLRI